MQKIISIITFLLITNVVVYAQVFPGYGTVSDEEINLKECDFEKSASAVVLLDEAKSDYDDQHQLVTMYHVRIKIFNAKGFSYANVSIPFFRNNEFEQIDMIEGMTINMHDSNQVSNLEKKSIFTEKTDQDLGRMIFAFPAIKAGSIIDYKYRSTMKHYGGLRDWYFQQEIPVLISRYSLVVLPNIEFAYRVNKRPELPIIIRPEKRGGVYFEMHNIPGLGEEPYMDAGIDYLQKAIFQLSGYNQFGIKRNYLTSWKELTDKLLMYDDFGGQLNKNIAGTGDFMKQTKTLYLPEQKMIAVFNYVRTNMAWNGDKSRFSSGLKNAWQKKSGTSSDINLLLVDLLKEVSLEAYPMLVSERYHGKVDRNYPFLDQFNSVFACVRINDKKYYLDATNKNVPPNLIPVGILNTTGFIVDREAGGLVNITDDSMQYKEDIFLSAEVVETGILSGTLLIKNKDYARAEKVKEYKKDKTKFLDKFTVVNGSGITGSKMELVNPENDSVPFEQYCKLSGNLNTSGEYLFLPLNLFTGFDKNPFLNDNRFSNINFGYKRTITLNISVKLPGSYVIEDIPKSVKLTDPDNNITFLRQLEYNKQDHFLKATLEFDFKNSLYETDLYPVIKEIYQKMFDYLKEPVVLKKNR